MCLTFYHSCHCFSFTIRCLFNVEHSNGDICTKVGEIWDIMVHFINFHASVHKFYIQCKQTIKINPVFFCRKEISRKSNREML